MYSDPDGPFRVIGYCKARSGAENHDTDQDNHGNLTLEIIVETAPVIRTSWPQQPEVYQICIVY